jgi:hypothetical protein
VQGILLGTLRVRGRPQKFVLHDHLVLVRLRERFIHVRPCRSSGRPRSRLGRCSRILSFSLPGHVQRQEVHQCTYIAVQHSRYVLPTLLPGVVVCVSRVDRLCVLLLCVEGMGSVCLLLRWLHGSNKQSCEIRCGWRCVAAVATLFLTCTAHSTAIW